MDRADLHNRLHCHGNYHKMSTTLAIFTYPQGSETLKRHWTYFLNQKADALYSVVTTDVFPRCEVPPDTRTIAVGESGYIDGPRLPNRLLDTIEMLLMRPWSALILTEYDTVFFKPIDLTYLWTVAGHYAGSQTWGSKAKSFYHNPWVFTRATAAAFLGAGRAAIREGICPGRVSGQGPAPECSPDVFFGYVCESLKMPVQKHLWTEYSRNSLDIEGHLGEARDAYQQGVQIIHGIKTQKELEFILS